jgi:rfaE bifunctional protein nucleotidyltransferase chain/domain
MIATTTQQRKALSAMLQGSMQTIVFTNGVFDILHVGHATYLEQAKAMGSMLVVGVNSDASVRTLGKGANRPVNSELDRAQLLQALRCVDHVMIFEESTPLETIVLLQPHVLVKGGDYSIDTIVGANEVLARGGEVHTIPLVEGKSTTAIINRAQTA